MIIRGCWSVRACRPKTRWLSTRRAAGQCAGWCPCRRLAAIRRIALLAVDIPDFGCWRRLPQGVCYQTRTTWGGICVCLVSLWAMNYAVPETYQLGWPNIG